MSSFEIHVIHGQPPLPIFCFAFPFTWSGVIVVIRGSAARTLPYSSVTTRAATNVRAKHSTHGNRKPITRQTRPTMCALKLIRGEKTRTQNQSSVNTHLNGAYQLETSVHDSAVIYARHCTMRREAKSAVPCKAEGGLGGSYTVLCKGPYCTGGVTGVHP